MIFCAKQGLNKNLISAKKDSFFDGLFFEVTQKIQDILLYRMN